MNHPTRPVQAIVREANVNAAQKKWLKRITAQTVAGWPTVPLPFVVLLREIDAIANTSLAKARGILAKHPTRARGIIQLLSI